MIELFISLVVAGAALWIPLFLLVKLQIMTLRRLPPAIWMPFAITGVPCHELSHAVTCLVTGHKIQQLELFKPDDSGTLGFVTHAYRPGVLSWFTNLLIGLAPLPGGALAIWGITYLFAPDLLNLSRNADWRYESVILSTWQFLADTFNHIGALNWLSPYTWLWLYLSVSIAMFMVPSLPDFRGAAKGIAAVCVVYFIFALAYLNSAFDTLSSITRLAYTLYPLWIAAIALFTALLLLASIVSRFQKTGVKPTS